MSNSSLQYLRLIHPSSSWSRIERRRCMSTYLPRHRHPITLYSISQCVVSAIKELVADANFECIEEGITLQEMDNSHDALTAVRHGLPKIPLRSSDASGCQLGVVDKGEMCKGHIKGEMMAMYLIWYMNLKLSFFLVSFLPPTCLYILKSPTPSYTH